MQQIIYNQDMFVKPQRSRSEYTYEKRYEFRKKKAPQILAAFWAWLEKLHPVKGSRMARAVTYALNQQPYAEHYLQDGRCSLSNNPSENSIQPFTVGRKNWLFCDTPGGAHASATVYTMAEMAKAHGLNTNERRGVFLFRLIKE